MANIHVRGIVLAIALATACQAQTFRETTGYNQLMSLFAPLPANMPNGQGVTVAITEASEAGGAYRPAPQAGKNYIYKSGGSVNTSSHASVVANNYFSTAASIAPGVTTIEVFAAGGWLNGDYLNGLGPAAPNISTARVYNHSWISLTESTESDYTAKIDFTAVRDNVLQVVGVNNGSGLIVPPLLARSFNCIAVGLSNGNNSHGPTGGLFPGRCKPDIVAIDLGAPMTSWSTPIVSGAVATLIDAAERVYPFPPDVEDRATEPETIKAILLAGATKEEFASFVPPWNQATSAQPSGHREPLDRRFGAGELNIFNSYLILISDEQDGTDTTLDFDDGWDHETLSLAGKFRRYYFDVPEDAANVVVSGVVCWNRNVVLNLASYGGQLPVIYLRLYNVTGESTLGTLVDASVSPIDNVQHIYRTALPPGRYAWEMELISLPLTPLPMTSTDVAIAWRVDYASELPPDVISPTLQSVRSRKVHTP